MITSNCPRCQESFRVPAGQLPDDAYATCPWCRETFPLSEVLASLPPTLEISTADGEPLVVREHAALGFASAGIASEQSGDGFEVLEEDLDKTVGNETVMSETIAEDSWNQTSFEVDEDHVDLQVEDPSDSWDTPQDSEPPVPMTVALRSRRKKSSGLRTLIGIVVGGLLSVPIALGILLLVGREPNLGFWPFDGHGSRRAPTSAPPVSLSERPRNTNNNRGRTLDTSAFDEAMANIEDPTVTAIDELMPPTLDSDSGNPIRQPSGDELALTAESPTLVDVNQDSGGPTLPDLPHVATPEVPSSDTNTARGVETVGLETAGNTSDSPEAITSDGPSLELPDTNELPLTNTDFPALAPSPSGESSPVGDSTADDQKTMPLPNLDVPSLDPGNAAEEPTLEPANGFPIESPLLDAGSERVVAGVDDQATPEMTLPEPEIVPEVGSDPEAGTDADPGKKIEAPIPPKQPAASAEAIARVKAAQDSIKKLLSLDDSDSNRKRQLARTYAKIAEACNVSEDDRGALPSLASELLEPPLLEDIEFAGTQWLIFANRPTDGIALIGRPGTSPDGEIVTLESGKIVNLLGNASVPTVVRVLIMGRIVDGETTVEVAHVEPLPPEQE